MKSKEFPRWVIFVVTGWVYALVGGFLGALRGISLTAHPTSDFVAAFAMAIPAGLVLFGLAIGLVAGLVVGEFIALVITLILRAHGKENVRRRLDVHLDPFKANQAIEAKASAEGVTPEAIRHQLIDELNVVNRVLDAWLSGDRIVPGFMLTRLAKALDTTRENIVVVEESRGARSEEETHASR